MPTQEAESIASIGRQIAGDAAHLVRDEISLAKAEIFGILRRAAGLIGAIFATLISFLFFLLFTVGTVDEGLRPSDNWAIGLAVVSAIVGAIFLAGGFRFRSFFATILMILGAVLEIGFVVLTFVFYITTLLATGPDAARKGWDISAMVFFCLMLLSALLAGVFGLRIKRGFGETVGNFKEDVEWLRHLTKQNGNAN